MAYRFKHRETVPQNVKRIAAEQLDSAIALLKGKPGESREDSVHKVRKSVKKTRALMRLVRPELGKFFRDENIRLSDVGQKLSALRDAAALVGTVNNLRRRQNGPGPGKRLASAARIFQREKRRIEEEAWSQNLLPTLAAELGKARRTIRYWPLYKDGFQAIAAGLEKTYRDGKKAMAVARKTGRIEDYHEWRKRAKDLWYHVRLLNRIWGEVMSAHEQSLKQLEDALGEDINLSVLERQAQRLTSQGASLPTPSLRKAVASARGELREQALAIGEKIYAEKPRDFIGQIKKLWKAW